MNVENNLLLDVVCPFKSKICKVFLENSLSSQLENDGGKLLGMARGVEAPTFPQFIQVGNEKMPFLGNNTSMPIQGSLSNMILAALLEVTVNGCLSHLTFLYLPWEPVLRKDCRIHFTNLPVYVAEELISSYCIFTF